MKSSNARFLSLPKNAGMWKVESHLNKWATQNVHSSLPPSFCYDETYPNLNRIDPIIVAVRKMVKTRDSK